MIEKLQTPFDITIGGSSSDAESPQLLSEEKIF
jgi:hypothetical protein